MSSIQANNRIINSTPAVTWSKLILIYCALLLSLSAFSQNPDTAIFDLELGEISELFESKNYDNSLQRAKALSSKISADYNYDRQEKLWTIIASCHKELNDYPAYYKDLISLKDIAEKSFEDKKAKDQIITQNLIAESVDSAKSNSIKQKKLLLKSEENQEKMADDSTLFIYGSYGLVIILILLYFVNRRIKRA